MHQSVEVIGPIAQARHLDGEDIQAIEEVSTELAVLDGCLDVPVSGCDDSNIATDRLVVAHTLEDPLLQHAQQLHLHRGAHIADLIQEQCAAFSDLETPPPRRIRAGERAFFMPEELAFHQFGRYRTTVHRDESPAAARARFVDSTGDNLFAGTGFPENQDVRVVGRHLSDEAHHLPYGGGGTARVTDADRLFDSAGCTNR